MVDRFSLEGGIWSLVSRLNDDLANLGFMVIGIFAAAWGLSAVVYRCKGYHRLAQVAEATE